MIVTAAFMGLLMAGQPPPAPIQPKAEEGVLQSLDNKCPVTGKTVAPDKGVKAVVRGRDYLVYNQAAADELAANPDKYLEADGTPKNAKKHDGPGHR